MFLSCCDFGKRVYCNIVEWIASRQLLNRSCSRVAVRRARVSFNVVEWISIGHRLIFSCRKVGVHCDIVESASIRRRLSNICSRE